MVIAPASRHIRLNSHGGALPVCNGRSASCRFITNQTHPERCQTEEVGFEPTAPLRAHRFSRPAVKTTHLPLSPAVMVSSKSVLANWLGAISPDLPEVVRMWPTVP